MIIDCHAHLVPPALLDAIRAERAKFPSVRVIEETDRRTASSRTQKNTGN